MSASYDDLVSILGIGQPSEPKPEKYDSLKSRVLKNAVTAGVSPDIAEDFTHVIKNIESGGRHWKGTELLKSDMGATGISQVVPDKPGSLYRTVKGRKYDLSDIDQNLQAGLSYFAEGGADPVGRRLYYFGGPKAKGYYDTHGAIPPGGEWATDKKTGKRFLRTSFHSYIDKTLPKNGQKVARPAATESPSVDIDQVYDTLGVDKSEPAAPKEPKVELELGQTRPRRVEPPIEGEKPTPAHTGLVGQIIDLGPEAEKAYRDYIQRNVRPPKGGTAQTVDAAFKDEANAHTFIEIQKALADTANGSRRQKINALAQVGIQFLQNPDTKGKVLPSVLHAALISAHLTVDQYKQLPANLKQQIRDYRQRKQARIIAAQPQGPQGTIAQRGATQGIPSSLLPADPSAFSVTGPQMSVEQQREAAPTIARGAVLDHIDRLINNELRRQGPGLPPLAQRLETAGLPKEIAEQVAGRPEPGSIAEAIPRIRQEVIAERAAEKQLPPELANNPLSAIYKYMTEGGMTEDEAVNAETLSRLEAAKDTFKPEYQQQLRAELKSQGEMYAGTRIAYKPWEGMVASTGKEIAGLLDALPFDDTQKLAQYMNLRSNILLAASKSEPLNQLGEEIKRGIPEKVATAVSQLGMGIGELVILKKATGLSMTQIMGAQALLETNDAPLKDRVRATAQAALLGKVLESHLSRPLSALVFGAPTALEGVASGKKAEDVIIDTVVQSGVGAVLGGKGLPGIAEALRPERGAPAEAPGLPEAAPETAPTVERAQEPEPGDVRFANLDNSQLQQLINARPKKGTKPEVRVEFAKKQKAAQMELTRRIQEPPAPSVEMKPAGEAQPGDVPSFQEFVENHPRGGVRFDTLTPDDPLFKERAAEYVQKYGGQNARQQVQREGGPPGGAYSGGLQGEGRRPEGGAVAGLRDSQQAQTDPQAPVQEGIAQGQGAPAQDVTRSISGQNFRDLIAEHNGDMEAASNDLANTVIVHLLAGRKVTLYADGKPNEIVSVNRGMMQDSKGRRWGTMNLATDKTGGSRIEISGRTTSPAATAPESDATLAQQMKNEDVVLVPPNRAMPALIPPRFESMETEQGTFLFDPAKIPRATIEAKIKDGTWHQLLGHLEPKGPTTTNVVTARAPTGEEQKSSVVTPGNEAAQAAELKKRYPDAQIETGGPEQAQKVIDERKGDYLDYSPEERAQQAKDIETEKAAEVSPEEKKARDRLTSLKQTLGTELADIDKRVAAGRLTEEDGPWRKKAAIQRANDERQGVLAKLPEQIRDLVEPEHPVFDDTAPTPAAPDQGPEAAEPPPKVRVPSKGFKKSDPATNSLSEETRARGGIRTDKTGANKGEVQRLKESGVRGLVNEKSGKTAEEMAMSLAQDGYFPPGVEQRPDGSINITDPNAFLAAIEDDARGVQRHYSSGVDKGFVEEERDYWKSQMTPDEWADYEKEEKLQTNNKAIQLLEKVRNGDRTTKTADAFRKIARKYGVSKEATDRILEAERTYGAPAEGERPADIEPPPGEQRSQLGPGAANIGDVPLASTVNQLTEAIKKNAGKGSVEDRVRVSVGDKMTDAKDALTRSFLKVRAASRAIYDAYARLPAFTDFKRATGEWLGANQRADYEVRQMVRAGKKSVKNPLTREAMLNWIEADGDVKLLSDRAAQSKGAVKRGYEAALKLSDQEQNIARNIQSYYEARLQEGINAGILDHGIEDYVNHIWKKENPVTKKLMADLQIGKLQPDFKFAKKRIFESDFDGEQAGHVSPTKDIFDRVAVYDQAFNRAIASRGYIRSLLDGKASDGRPLVAVSGSGKIIPGEGGLPESVIIRPKTKPQDTLDYKSIDHPALRKWKWATSIELEPGSQSEVVIPGKGTEQSSEEPIPVILQGDMMVHPEAYQHMKNMFSTSAFRRHPIGKALLTLQSTIKQTMLSISGFHQVQEEIHALGHRVNVANMRPLDFSDSKQTDLINHGLMIADYDAMSSFSEGLAGGNLTNKIPVIGPRVLEPYQEWLFKDHIPKLKMNMALHALDRNMIRYAKDIERGKVTRDQILEMTANQANAAFGELNYKYMGRNPTLQDAFRAFVLAPDFLEARARFVGQALKPRGREQLVALGLLAGAQFVTARVVNSILDEKHDPHWDKPFSVVYKGHEYSLRTVPGDIAHLISDPRSFFYHRMSPLMRTAVQGLTGRDDRGQKLDAQAQIKDFFESPLPIAFRRRQGDAWWESFMNATGVTEKKYRTQAEEMMRQHFVDTLPQTPQTPAEKERSQLRKQLEDKIRAGQNVDKELDEAVKTNKLRPADKQSIKKDALSSAFQLQFKKLPLKDALDVYDKMEPQEKEATKKELVDKYWNAYHSNFKGLTVKDADALKERVKKLGVIKPSAVTTSPAPEKKTDFDYMQELLGP